MAIHVVNEARRCLHCKKPLCREGCPISTNIPEAIELFRTGRKLDLFAEEVELIMFRQGKVLY